MTENTPIAMPNIVRAERSLFTPIEAKAILRISMTGIGIFEFRVQISDFSPSISLVASAMVFREPTLIAVNATPTGKMPWCDLLIPVPSWSSSKSKSKAKDLRHSYLSATTGSRREAPHAGMKPDKTPVSTDAVIPIRTSTTENSAGKLGI